VRAKAIVPFFATAAVVALLLPGVATAGVKPASRGIRPTVSEEFELQGTNGYAVTVTLDNRRKLSLSADHSGARGLTLVKYALDAPQARGSDDIKARIGKLGRIDLRFVPRSVHESKSTPHDCHGGKTITEEGHFVGLIVFRGERDFTRVRATSVSGSVAKVPALRCPALAPSPPEKQVEEEDAAIEAQEAKEDAENEVEQVNLLAKLNGKRRIVEFGATRTSARKRDGSKFSASNFFVVAGRRLGRIEEASVFLDLFEPGSKFRLVEPLRPIDGAVVKPPAPFSGTATFKREAPLPARWSGNLKVDLPGFGIVPLAGPAFHTTMCENPGCPIL
jgi:hypothetical protein